MYFRDELYGAEHVKNTANGSKKTTLTCLSKVKVNQPSTKEIIELEVKYEWGYAKNIEI